MHLCYIFFLFSLFYTYMSIFQLWYMIPNIFYQHWEIKVHKPSLYFCTSLLFYYNIYSNFPKNDDSSLHINIFFGVHLLISQMIP